MRTTAALESVFFVGAEVDILKTKGGAHRLFSTKFLRNSTSWFARVHSYMNLDKLLPRQTACSPPSKIHTRKSLPIRQAALLLRREAFTLATIGKGARTPARPTHGVAYWSATLNPRPIGWT